jgi:hypothetical protein
VGQSRWAYLPPRHFPPPTPTCARASTTAAAAAVSCGETPQAPGGLLRHAYRAPPIASPTRQLSTESQMGRKLRGHA